jgi:hypothetical protein
LDVLLSCRPMAFLLTPMPGNKHGKLRRYQTRCKGKKTAATALGKQLVDEQRNLDEQFAFRTITALALDAQVRKIGLIQALIRAEHLRTPIEQTALLTKNQIDK